MAARKIAQAKLDDLKGKCQEDIRDEIRQYGKNENMKDKKKDQIDRDLKKIEEEIVRKKTLEYLSWFEQKKQKEPELGQQQDDFAYKLQSLIQEEFSKQKATFEQLLEKNKRLRNMRGRFDEWNEHLSKHMIELNNQGKMPEFDQLWDSEIKKKEQELEEESKKVDIYKFFQEKFDAHFKTSFLTKEERAKFYDNKDIKVFWQNQTNDKYLEIFKDLVPLASEITDKGDPEDQETKKELESQSKQRDMLISALKNERDTFQKDALLDSDKPNADPHEDIPELLSRCHVKIKEQVDICYQSPVWAFYPFITYYSFLPLLEQF